MNVRRLGRIGQEIKKTLSVAIQYKLKDPRVQQMTSITGVKLSPDLSYCDVFVSVLGQDWDKKQALEGLESAKGFLKNEIAQGVEIRQIPELRFHIDNSIEHGLYMDQLIAKTLEEDRAAQIERGDIHLEGDPGHDPASAGSEPSEPEEGAANAGQ
jgi:ribosome-binding factor A